MKVLMLAPGNSVHAQRPLNLLLENGCDVTFMDSIDPLPGGRKNYHFLPYPLARGKRWFSLAGKHLAEQMAYWSVVLQLRACWQRLRPDVIHMHWISPRRAKQCLDAGMRPFVLSAWGSDINNHFKPDANPSELEWMKDVLTKADVTIVDAQDVARKCAQLAGQSARTELLPLGVDTRRFRPGYEEAARNWRQKLDIPSDAFVLLSIRAWNPVYGHHRIVEAFADAVPHLKVQTVLLFKRLNVTVYPDAEAYEKQMFDRINVLGLTPYVRWLEEVPFEQLPEIYALADGILNYPAIDAFPVTFAEAAACERPVITVRLPAYEGTFAERYFSMVEPGDTQKLSQEIVRLVNAPDDEKKHRQQLLERARKEVVRLYDEQIYSQGLLDIYRELEHQT